MWKRNAKYKKEKVWSIPGQPGHPASLHAVTYLDGGRERMPIIAPNHT